MNDGNPDLEIDNLIIRAATGDKAEAQALRRLMGRRVRVVSHGAPAQVNTVDGRITLSTDARGAVTQIVIEHIGRQDTVIKIKGGGRQGELG